MRSAAAQALIEFALAISMFLLLVLGTFDLAPAHLSCTVRTNASREASRYAAAHYVQTGWQSASQQAGRNLAAGDDTANLPQTVSTSGSLSGYVTVTGAYRFHTLTPFVGALLG